MYFARVFYGGFTFAVVCVHVRSVVVELFVGTACEVGPVGLGRYTFVS